MKEILLNKIVHHQFLLKKNNKTLRIIFFLRLIAGMSFILSLYFWIRFHEPIWGFMFSAFVVGFLYILLKNSHYLEQNKYYKRIIQINENELHALNWEFSKFENGHEFIDPHHPYSADLDIFGNRSIFQSLNRTVIQGARNRLANLLIAPFKVKEEVVNQQNNIKDLSSKLEFRQNFAAYGMAVEESPSDILSLSFWIKEKSIFLHTKAIRILRYVMPVLSILSFVLYLADSKFLSIFLLFSGAIWFITAMNAKRINHIHLQLTKKGKMIGSRSKLFELIHLEKFQSPQLLSIQTKCEEAAKNFKELGKIVEAFDTRLNALIYLVLNTFLAFDLIVIIRLEKWKERNKDKLVDWFQILDEFDSLNSLANFAWANPEYVFPEISANEMFFEAQEISHPLMPKQQRVANSIIFDTTKFVILTGANMSGKSTFLRTIGINMIFAFMGMPVSAKSLKLSMLKLMTSMKVADSLVENTSYFLAELKRLQSIMAELQKEEKVFILLDEILKGTNSADKLEGSIKLVRKFLSLHCLGIIATHDIELAKLENEYPDPVCNMSFESDISKSELIFDYKIRLGPAKTKNAALLMQRMGIVD